jgi:LmbE family N-acetylglucosaminyl deacetylase
MLNLTFGDIAQSPLRVLAIGAHADDIEIGCGGTLLRLLESVAQVHVCWVVLSADGERAREAEESANAFLANAERHRFMLGGFRDGYFPSHWAEIKERFESLKEVKPDLILTHYRHDLHQDHRLVSELTWNTFRDHLILEYEIPKYDGDLGTPNLFVPLDQATCRRKIDTLLQYFPSQRGRRWFTEDLFLSLLRLRGMESNSESRYAEAFFCRKAVVWPA